MANWGSFAGGLAQGISAGLPLLMKQREQEQLMELEKQKLDLKRQEEEAKLTREKQGASIKAAGEALKSLSVNAPEQVPVFTSGFIKRWKEQYGDMAPTLENAFKRDPIAILDVIQNSDPDQLRAIMGNEEAFLTVWPHLVEANKTAKARKIEDQIAGATLGFVTEQSRAGTEPIDAELFAAEEVVKALREAGATDARVEAAQKRVDKLKDQRLSLATSPTAQATIAAGGQVSGPLSGAGARAAQERELELGRTKAFGESQAGQQGEFAGSRLSVEEAARLGQPAFAPKPWFAPEGSGGIIPPSPQTQAMQTKSYESVLKQAEKDSETSAAARSELTITNQILDTVKRLGPNVTGPGALATFNREVTKRFAPLGATSTDLQSLSSMVTWKAIKHTKAVAPVSNPDFEKVASSIGGENLSYNANLQVLQAMQREERRGAAIGSIAGAFREGRMGKDVSYEQRKNMALNALEKQFAKDYPGYKPEQFGEPSVVAPAKGGAAVPGKPQPGKVSSSGVNLPIWKNFDPEVVAGIANLPSTMHRILGAVAVQETGGRNDAIHAADARGERALGAFGIKPSSGRDFGLGVISIKNPKDPMQAAQFVADAMEKLLAKYNNNPVVALAAYNQGMGAVDTYLEQSKTGAVTPSVKKTFDKGMAYGRSVMQIYERMSPLRQGPPIAQAQPAKPSPMEQFPRTTKQREALVTGLEGTVTTMLGGGGLGGAARIGLEAGLSAIGTKAAHKAGLGGIGRTVGGIAGSAAGSGIASLTVDPVREPYAEAAKAAMFNLVPDVLEGGLRTVFSKGERTIGGQALENVLREAEEKQLSEQLNAKVKLKGTPTLTPVTILDNYKSNLQYIGANSLIAGSKIADQSAAIDKVIVGAGQEFAGRWFHEKAQISSYYAAADALRSSPVDIRAVKVLNNTIKDRLGVTLEKTVTADLSVVKYTTKIKELKDNIKFSDVDALHSDIMSDWADLSKAGKYEAAADLVKLARGLDDAYESAMRAMGEGPAYEAMKRGRELSRENRQGQYMQFVLDSATAPGTGVIHGPSMLSRLTKPAIEKAPVKLTDEQVKGLTDIALAAKENQRNNGFLKWTTMTGELGGMAAIGLSFMTGSAAGLIPASIAMLTPSVIAKMITNPTTKKLLIDGMKTRAGTADAFNIGTKLMASVIKEGYATPYRMPSDEQRQYPVLSAQPPQR